MDLVVRRRRAALFVLFFVPGLGISSWVTRTPAIRDVLGASTAEMGLVLFGLSLGSMAGILASGALVARFSTRPVILVGSLSVVASLLVVAAGAATGQPVVVAAGLALFGLGMGGGEVAMNVEGGDVERVLGRSVLPTLHGFFSLGTVVGATLGLVLTAADFSAPVHLVTVSAVALVAVLLALPHVAAGVGRTTPAADAVAVPDAPTTPRPALWRDTRLVLIGVVVLAMAFAEGSANDWLPLLMVDGHGFDPALGSGVYAVFAAAMTIGRFAGEPLLDRFGRIAVMRASAISGGIGLALVVFVDSQVVAAAAVLLWGLGAALGFPVALSAAGDSGDPAQAASRISLVATIGYLAFLVGPPVLGFLGEHVGLRPAMIVVLCLVAVAAVLAPALGQRPGWRGAGTVTDDEVARA
ncbi:MFS transporter [Cellulomonas triticagri]|uniref:MFS transporter n=1 Tax=Cellulomonas triticagri TaxID=2483352 RepID=A0A3M2JBF2_9CELL|nr:MFS transporter [Cellulomonas triticagri]RMI09556.1 MFS transporter [Cellulomonas triticagri]